ncbi:MAG: LCP family protein [Patescibacteria group bacterium]|nr:LCP family protein [Patescibacteria group bacterium]
MPKKKFIPIIIISVLLIFVGKLILSNLNVFPFMFQLIFNRDIQLKQSASRINILLLGIGGGTHDGPDLTDTIIFASLDEKNNKVTLVSIPRDLWSPELNQKINTAYTIGESKKKGGGLTLAEAAVAKITGQNIDYGVRIDFSGFVKAIDIVGGLNVNVDNAFDDYQYPIDGKEEDPCGHNQNELEALATAASQLEAFPCRYKHLHFDKGPQRMDGKAALEFVRSRHGQGDEGTDFSRSRRQEKVIKAFKEKALSAETLLNPAKIISLYETLKSSIDTDIKQDEFDDFIRLAQKMKTAKIQSTVLDYGDEQKQRQGLLQNPQPSSDYNYEWVLIPRIGNGNYKEIQKYIDCEIKTGNCPVSAKPQN